MKIIGLFIAFFVVFLSCKKDKADDNTTANLLNSCSTSFQELTIDGVDFNIILDTAYQTSNSFYTLHKVKDGLGCSFDFGTTDNPKEGSYSITSSFLDINKTNNKVYIEVFIEGTAYQAQSGIVTVKGAGSTSIVEFCKIKCKNSLGIEHQVSLKSDFQ